MALISCPECNNEISSAAVACPHCGYPLVAAKGTQTPPPPKSEPLTASPPRVEGTKEKPLQIGSGSWHGAEIHATTAINNLLKTQGWQRVAVEGDSSGICCWKVLLPDGSTDAVWFDFSTTANWIKRREQGEVGGILDSVDPKKREQLVPQQA